MKFATIISKSRTSAAKPMAVRLISASLITLALAGCKTDETAGGFVAGWQLTDPSQRHPILVSQEPARLSIAVPRGANGLSPHQRANVMDFIARNKGGSNAKVAIAVPAGAPNEVAAVRAADDLRKLFNSHGISAVSVEAYSDDGDPQPPIRVAYNRYIAEGPTCGQWPDDLGKTTQSTNYENFGCAMQKNLAAQVANPADLLGPREETPRSAERRGTVWDKYIKGESTVAKKDESEKTKVKGSE